MSAKTYVQIAGQTLDPAALTLPATREDRGAWTVDPDNPNAIIVDPVLAKQLRVPVAVTKVSLKRACEEQTNWGGSGLNLWQIAKAAIATMPESAQDDWNLSTQIPRTDPMFNAFATSPEVGATTGQVDDIFIRAKEIDEAGQ